MSDEIKASKFEIWYLAGDSVMNVGGLDAILPNLQILAKVWKLTLSSRGTVCEGVRS